MKYAKIIFTEKDFTTTVRKAYASAFAGNFLVYEPDPSHSITVFPLPFLPGKRKGMVE